MKTHSRLGRFLLLGALATIPPACGTPLPTITGPQRTLATQGSQSNIPPVATSGGAAFVVVVRLQAPPVPTSASGATLEASVDWTFASNPVAIGWARGDCTQTPNCEVISQNTGSAKPKMVTAVNLQAGLYSLFIANLGTTSESVSYQIYVTQ